MHWYHYKSYSLRFDYYLLNVYLLFESSEELTEFSF